MDRPKIKVIYDGPAFQICGIVENGQCPVKIFIDSLAEPAQKSIMALLKRAGDNGPPKNREKFRKLTDEELYEFKDYQTRIFCHFDKGKKLILTHGFIKKKDKPDKNEIKKACELLKSYREEGR